MKSLRAGAVVAGASAAVAAAVVAGAVAAVGARSRWAGAAVAALLAGSVLAGCGGASSQVPNVKRTITREFAAVANGDGAAACSLATPGGQKLITTSAPPGFTCAQVITVVGAHLSAPVKAALRSVVIKKVTITGRHANVKNTDITSTKGSFAGFLQTSGTTPLIEESDGSWKMTS